MRNGLPVRMRHSRATALLPHLTRNASAAKSNMLFILFGALVWFKPAGPGSKLVDDDPSSSDRKKAKKWRARLVPAMLVGTSLTPGCEWAGSYLIVPLAATLCDSRSTRASVRRVADVTFPETVSFPMKQRLNFFGAFEDLALPAPRVSDDTESFTITTGEDQISDSLQYDGLVKENAPLFGRAAATEVMMVLDPAPDHDDLLVDSTEAWLLRGRSRHQGGGEHLGRPDRTRGERYRHIFTCPAQRLAARRLWLEWYC